MVHRKLDSWALVLLAEQPLEFYRKLLVQAVELLLALFLKRLEQQAVQVPLEAEEHRQLASVVAAEVEVEQDATVIKAQRRSVRLVHLVHRGHPENPDLTEFLAMMAYQVKMHLTGNRRNQKQNAKNVHLDLLVQQVLQEHQGPRE